MTSWRARAAELEPQPEDLRHLSALHGILGALNDPHPGIGQLIHFCMVIPSLAGRILLEAQRLVPDREVADVGYALYLLGNRGLEAVLLEYLEDLTELKTDIEERTVRNVLDAPYVQPTTGAPPRASTAPPPAPRRFSAPQLRAVGRKITQADAEMIPASLRGLLKPLS